jgi:predicted amidohydrolase YtcJ
LSEQVCASNGSDAPVETPDVLKGIQLAMTRCSVSSDASMNPNECLTAEQAIDSYTICGARNFFAEDRYGSLREGNYADFAVLEQPIETCPTESVRDIRILMTVMNGETVFER